MRKRYTRRGAEAWRSARASARWTGAGVGGGGSPDSPVCHSSSAALPGDVQGPYVVSLGEPGPPTAQTARGDLAHGDACGASAMSRRWWPSLQADALTWGAEGTARCLPGRARGSWCV